MEHVRLPKEEEDSYYGMVMMIFCTRNINTMDQIAGLIMKVKPRLCWMVKVHSRSVIKFEDKKIISERRQCSNYKFYEQNKYSQEKDAS
jgi:hypothetical protein